MQKTNELQSIVSEIELLIRYAVLEEDRQKAQDLLEKYTKNRIALQLIREYYSSLPEAREEALIKLVRIDRRQGAYLLGASTGGHEYIYFVTDDGAGCLGEYAEQTADQEVLEFFGYADKQDFLKRNPVLNELTDFFRAAEKAHCPVCSVAVGEYHHLGCPVEVCPWCLGQLSRCNCRFDLMRKEELTSEEDVELFEALLSEKGRIRYEDGQGPSYPVAGETPSLK